MPKTPKQIHEAKMKFLGEAEARLAKSVSKSQKSFYLMILEDYLPKFDVNENKIADTAKNTRLINTLDNLFAKLEKILQRDALAPMARDLVESLSFSSNYYVALGFKKTVVNNLVKNKVNLERKLGISGKGKLAKDGYIYRLGQTDAVRQQLRDYVLKNLTGDVAFTDFQLGFRNLVIGNKRVKSLPTTGVLDRYFDQYAIDSFSQVDAVANKQIATELNLDHFIFEGSLINNSRKFCQKRAGKAFKVSETKTWKNDPDLIDKKTKDAYLPLVERGRYRCRHSIRYITESLYNQLK